MKLITFLGTGKYQETTYEMQGKKAVTQLFPIALVQFLSPSTVIAVVTKQSKDIWESKLVDDLTPFGTKLEIVDIPEGHSVADLWSIFEKITDSLEWEDRVIFDITHSFRTLPFLSFLAASYLRVAKKVTIEGIYYGAFEARQPAPPSESPMPSPQTDISPVFDLSPFLTLLEWTNATDKFNRTGYSDDLSSLLTDRQDEIWKNRGAFDGKKLPTGLKAAGKALNSLSQALAVPRTKEIVKHVLSVEEVLKKNAEEIKEWSKPFFVLLDRTQDAYSGFRENNLDTERKIIGWYAERGQVLQALTLAREWIVSWLADQLGKNDMADRQSIEDGLNKLIYQKIQEQKIDDASPLETRIKDHPKFKRLSDLWSNTSRLRNDAAHCGYNSQPLSADNLFNGVKKVVEDLNGLVDQDASHEFLPPTH